MDVGGPVGHVGKYGTRVLASPSPHTRRLSSPFVIRATQSGNNHIQPYSNLTVLAASGMISTTSPWRFALVCSVPAVRRSCFSLGVSSKRVEARTEPLRRGIDRANKIFQSLAAQFGLVSGTVALFSCR